jgi:low affinity Fe/Cu permease
MYLGLRSMSLAEKEHGVRHLFGKFAHKVSLASGSSWAFILACTVIVVWAVTGPVFGFSDTWQLVINTGTTIVTFLMVFLIQNTQNRDTTAMQLKLDELLRAVAGAREGIFADLQDQDEQVIQQVRDSLYAECGTCSSPEEHARHAAAAARLVETR